jgi:putative cell wall-binding protein
MAVIGLVAGVGTVLAPAAFASDGAGPHRGSVHGSAGSSAERQVLTPDRQARLSAAPGVQGALPTDQNAFGRISGANRYETAVAISRAMVCDKNANTTDPTDPAYCKGLGNPDQLVTEVFIASALNFPDALGAGPVASGIGPLLLVPPTGTVPKSVLNELDRIAPQKVVVFGGTGAVSDAVVTQLKAHTTGKAAERLAGANRYATASNAAVTNDQIWRGNDDNNDGTPDNHGLDVIVLASGETYADALGGGGAAANARGSLLLTQKSVLPKEAKAALQSIKPPKVIIAGGTGAVSSAVESAVKAAVPASTVVRAAGANRFDTAIRISKLVFPSGASEVFLVNGFNFPDALASAPLAGYWGASTLLAQQTCVTAGTRAEASRLDPDYVTGIGGSGVVSDDAITLTTC